MRTRCIHYEYVHTVYFCFYTQALEYNVPVYYTGFVIGMAPMWVAVTSPLIGYFVRTPAAAIVIFATHLALSHVIFHSVL